MKISKKVIAELEKCYSIAPFVRGGKECFLVAAEKVNKCLLFDPCGNELETVWEGPGGVMSMVQVPGSSGQFLATHCFYSPNDSKNAKIVIASPGEKGIWDIRTLVELPFVHRFDILERNGVRYLIACTIKSGHEYKDDWSVPGKVYAAELPESLDMFDANHQLKLEVIKDEMLKNHGYYRVREEGTEAALISSDSGVYLFIPPESRRGAWEIKRILDVPASDAVLVDLDEDGEEELAVISPFHGDKILIYHRNGDSYEKVYEYDKPAEFSHAIYGGMLCRRPVVVIGHRKGERNIICFYYDKASGTYQTELIDHDCGAANVYCFKRGEKDVMIAANREINEVAMYELEQ